ncbi:MAG: haloacid dehalogenase-like hydrolase [Porticoccaceae bacterium]
MARDLGVEHIYCSNYEVEDGEFTGRILRPVCWGEGKVIALESLAAEHGVDLSKSCFYTDSDDDMEALERVGFPRIVNPNERLRTRASEKGWPVQEFARTGKPSLMPIYAQYRCLRFSDCVLFHWDGRLEAEWLQG